MIYFDNAATTSVAPTVLNKMIPYFTENYGNPSSLYKIGSDALKGITDARQTVAECLGAQPSEIYFTGSGSEADNWAIKGAFEALKNKGNKIITSAIEHHAVLETCKYLEGRGAEVVYLPVDEFGLVSPADLEKAIDDRTILVSIMYANNEIGTIEPIKELCGIAKKHGVLFHTDAVQAAGMEKIDVKELGVDMLSISAHKFHGPKGIGALYIRNGVRVSSFVHGGMQERGKRAGTENTAYIVGMAAALKEAVDTLEQRKERIEKLREKLKKGVLDAVPYTKYNGHPTNRLSGNVNFSFKYIEGESLLLRLEMAGFAASSGSACASSSLDPSHVLLAIGLPHEIAHGSLRVSLGDNNTEEEVDKFLEVIPGIVRTLREMSPLFEGVE